jgi:hypothetical protein
LLLLKKLTELMEHNLAGILLLAHMLFID